MARVLLSLSLPAHPISAANSEILSAERCSRAIPAECEMKHVAFLFAAVEQYGLVGLMLSQTAGHFSVMQTMMRTGW